MFGPIHLQFFTSTVFKKLKYYNPHFREGEVASSSLLLRPILSMDVKIKVPRRLIPNILWISFFEQTIKDINDYFHLSFKTAPKKDFAILSQETDIQRKCSRKPNLNKRQENQRQNAGCLTHWLNLEGDTASTCFRSPLCLPQGTELPPAGPELMFPLVGVWPSPLLTVSSLWSKFFILISH